ncbi:hypothetical protein Btru_003039 [Bulinus truncatus]|nr:hypothetical protein Btru_003039 [Bulinus truncatus]
MQLSLKLIISSDILVASEYILDTTHVSEVIGQALMVYICVDNTHFSPRRNVYFVMATLSNRCPDTAERKGSREDKKQPIRWLSTDGLERAEKSAAKLIETCATMFSHSAS